MAKALTNEDYAQAASALGVPVPVIRAVCAVESNGSGFLPDGRPKILFERHIFRRRLVAKGVSVDGLPADIVNSKAGGYLGNEKEWERIDRAIKIDRAAALESASWGMFQIMGFHWPLLGFASVQAYVNANFRSAGDQLQAFVKFILADQRLVRALRSRDWKTFASIYNGPNYAANKYDEKLAAAYKREAA